MYLLERQPPDYSNSTFYISIGFKEISTNGLLSPLKCAVLTINKLMVILNTE